MLLTPACQSPWMLFVFDDLTSLQLRTLLEGPPCSVPLSPLPFCPLWHLFLYTRRWTLWAYSRPAPGREGGLRSEKRHSAGAATNSMAAAVCKVQGSVLRGPALPAYRVCGTALDG